MIKQPMVSRPGASEHNTIKRDAVCLSYRPNPITLVVRAKDVTRNATAPSSAEFVGVHDKNHKPEFFPFIRHARMNTPRFTK